MNIKSQFKKSYKYYLKHVNTSTYFESQKILMRNIKRNFRI